MLRKIRTILAVLFFILTTGLFLDFTGTLHAWFGFLAKLQFWPSVLALNFGVVVFLVLLTLVFGRVYCSVICPLGVFQDIVSRLSGSRKGKKYRFFYSKAGNVLRYVILGLFIMAMIVGLGSFVALLDPYSAYGRIASNLFAPLWKWGNNLLALISERVGGYGFYGTDVWLKSLPTFIIAAVTLVVIVVLAWRSGRTYCNTICPVGSLLGLLSRFSLFRPVIDADKCRNCCLCERACKASCIDCKNHTIDYSRCVACMDCIDTCKHGALGFKLRTSGPAGPAVGETVAVFTGEKTTAKGEQSGAVVPTAGTSETLQPANGTLAEGKTRPTAKQTDAKEEQTGGANSRRSFLTGVGLVIGTAALKSQEKTVDGGFATILDKKIPQRATRIVPPGALSIRNLERHCTGCQLCVSVCPNGVLRPSTALETLMQPEASYERGYCRPECTKCSEVCPAGAIRRISAAEKSSVQIGHAVWIRQNCIPLSDGVECGNCARHCPTGAITMVPSDPADAKSLKIPVVNTERCIGCGACENLCPARPFSAIYVEGHEVHREI